jgi:hypothetical protein
MLPLGFRFDVNAVILEETAHTAACRLLPAALPVGPIRLTARETYWAQRCARECGCAPPFETLLSYKIEPTAGVGPVGGGDTS